MKNNPEVEMISPSAKYEDNRERMQRGAC